MRGYGVNRKRFNIKAHYPKCARRFAGLRLVAHRLRALRVRVMACYVLRPFAAHPAILRIRAFTPWRNGVPIATLYLPVVLHFMFEAAQFNKVRH